MSKANRCGEFSTKRIGKLLELGPALLLIGNVCSAENGTEIKWPGYITRHKQWQFGLSGETPCFGKTVRSICVPSVKEMPALSDAPELFLNKLHPDYERVVGLCLEERLFEGTKQQHLTGITDDLNMDVYMSLAIVNNHQ
jgi:hypothetical protein